MAICFITLSLFRQKFQLTTVIFLVLTLIERVSGDIVAGEYASMGDAAVSVEKELRDLAVDGKGAAPVDRDEVPQRDEAQRAGADVLWHCTEENGEYYDACIMHG